MAVSNNSVFDATTALFVNDIIDESEFVAVYDDTRRKSPEFQFWDYDKVETQLHFMTNDECRSYFRVDLEDLPVLAQALNIPERFVCPNRTLSIGMEGLCVALRRFAYPCRYSDMIPRFGRSVSELSLIAAEVTDHIFNTHGYLLADLNQPWLMPTQFTTLVALWKTAGDLLMAQYDLSVALGKISASCIMAINVLMLLTFNLLWHLMALLQIFMVQ